MDAFMEKLKNYEKTGVPKDAGTDSCEGFDLGRMRRLLHNLDNPQSKFKVRFLCILFLLTLHFVELSRRTAQ